MAHSNNIISQIKLPGSDIAYEIHDAQAIHSVDDLGLSAALVFKGVLSAESNLPTASANTIGHVYLVGSVEYVGVEVSGTTPQYKWEKLGNVHDAASSTHKHTVTVTGQNASSAVTGSASVTGENSSSKVTGSASIANAPSVSASAKYAKVTTGNDTFVKSYPGATSKMVTTSITPAGTATNVINSVTPTTGSITGVSGSTTASKATAGTAVSVAKVGTAVTLATRASSQTTVGNANVGTAVDVATGLTGGAVTAGSKGSAASWSASVSEGVLSFSFTPNTPTTPTAVTLPTATTTSITPAAASTTKIYGVGGTKSVIPAVDNGTITPYTFADVTVPTAAAEATTVVTGVSTGTASVATVGSATTVATGSLSSSGKGSSVMTGLGTATTASALTSASLATGTSTDGIHTGDDVTIGTQTLSGTIDGTAAAQTWSQKTGTISGSAAAQTWEQKTGSTGQPTT